MSEIASPSAFFRAFPIAAAAFREIFSGANDSHTTT